MNFTDALSTRARQPSLQSPILRNAKDIGNFTRPILICGGAYSNLEAFNAMLAEAARRDIPASHIIHTGDCVAYCADASATAQATRRAGLHAIAGNVEEQLGATADDCGCGFEEGSSCSQLSVTWYNFAKATLSPEMCRWMAALPTCLTFTMSEQRFAVIHGGATNISKFNFASLPDQNFEEELDLIGADVVVAGHTGIPFTKKIGNHIWHNSGALGMPANDGTPRVWVSVISPSEGGISIEHVPLTYDHQAAAKKMHQNGLPQVYAKALGTGLWPSLDILPPNETAATGTPLSPEVHHWHPQPRPLIEPEDRSPAPEPAASLSAPV